MSGSRLAGSRGLVLRVLLVSCLPFSVVWVGLKCRYGEGSASLEWTEGGFAGERERIFGRAGNANL